MPFCTVASVFSIGCGPQAGRDIMNQQSLVFSFLEGGKMVFCAGSHGFVLVKLSANCMPRLGTALG